MFIASLNGTEQRNKKEIKGRRIQYKWVLPRALLSLPLTVARVRRASSVYSPQLYKLSSAISI
jgi:hypothetical protein